jgi:hypothetical protein
MALPSTWPFNFSLKPKSFHEFISYQMRRDNAVYNVVNKIIDFADSGIQNKPSYHTLHTVVHPRTINGVRWDVTVYRTSNTANNYSWYLILQNENQTHPSNLTINPASGPDPFKGHAVIIAQGCGRVQVFTENKHDTNHAKFRRRLLPGDVIRICLVDHGTDQDLKLIGQFQMWFKDN